jgi:hypothetical protein
MERRTTRQAAGVFVVTLFAGLPFALEIGRSMAGSPDQTPPGAPAPASTGLADSGGSGGSVPVEGGPDSLPQAPGGTGKSPGAPLPVAGTGPSPDASAAPDATGVPKTGTTSLPSASAQPEEPPASDPPAATPAVVTAPPQQPDSGTDPGTG